MCSNTVWITATIGLFGVCLGALISRYTAFSIIARQERNKAFIALEASFIPTILILRKPKKTGEDFCRIPTLFENQTIAMLAFVGHLQGKSRRSFDGKWCKYQEWYQGYEESEAQSTHTPMGKLKIPKQIDEIGKMIEDILDAARK